LRVHVFFTPALSRNGLIPLHWKLAQVRRFNDAGRNTMYLGCHLKDLHFCPFLTKFGLSLQIFMKVPNIKLHGNPSCGRCADICGQTDGDGPHICYRRFWRLCGHAYRGSNYIPL